MLHPITCLLALAMLAAGDDAPVKSGLPLLADPVVHKAVLAIAGTPPADGEQVPDPAETLATWTPADAPARALPRLFVLVGDGYGTVMIATNLRTAVGKLGAGVLVIEESGLAERSDAWRMSLAAQIIEHVAACWSTPRERIVLVGYGSGARLTSRLLAGRDLPIGSCLAVRGLGEAPSVPPAWFAGLPLAVLAPPGASTPAWKLIDGWKPLGLRLGSFEGAMANGRPTIDDVSVKRFGEVAAWLDAQDDARSADASAAARQALAKDPAKAWELASRAAALARSATVSTHAAACLEELRTPTAAALAKLAARNGGLDRIAMLAPHAACEKALQDADAAATKAIAAMAKSDARTRLTKLAKLREANPCGPARATVAAAMAAAVEERVTAIKAIPSVPAKAKAWNELLALAPGSPMLMANMPMISADRFQAAHPAKP